MDLSHVLWIGGPGAFGWLGRALSRRFDLQLYSVDARTWLHEPRMPVTECSSLSLEEQGVHADPDQLFDWFATTSRHRFRLVLEDLARFPDAPGVVVEGRQLFPTSVAAVLRASDQALFLLPGTREIHGRDAGLTASDGERARANTIELDRRIAAAVERDVRDLRLQHLRVDARSSEMFERAAELLAPAVARMPAGGDLAAVRRAENDALVGQLRQVQAARGAETSYPFACECGEPGCEDVVELALDEYERLSAGGDRSPLRRPRS